MRGIELDAPLEDLLPIVDDWLSRFERAARAFPQTRAFHFLEETLCSLLSTSSWACDVPSIIEARADRGGTSCRVDVLLLTECAKTAVEAKIVWFGDSDGPTRKLIPALQAATQQLIQLPPEFASRRLALAFAVFERAETSLEILLQRTLAIRPSSLRAWYVDNTDSGPYPGFCTVGRLLSVA